MGLGVALSPTLLFIFTLGTPFGDALATEIIPSVPLYLVLSMVGVPPSIVGALLFRRGIRELVASQVLESMLETKSEPSVGVTNHPKGGRPVSPDPSAVPAKTSPNTSSRPVKTSVPPTQTTSQRPVGQLQRFSVKTKSEWKVCPGCGQSAELDAERCSYCGHGFPKSSADSCPVCGAPLTYARRITGDLYACGICFSELVKATA